MLAVREVLQRAVEHRDEIEQALPATRAELTPLYQSDELTVLKLVWAPGMWLQPHDHRMWAVIAQPRRRAGGQHLLPARGGGAHVVATGGKELHAGDVALLGDDVVHSVTNPLGVFTGAIHVYGGNFFHVGALRLVHGDPRPRDRRRRPEPVLRGVELSASARAFRPARARPRPAPAVHRGTELASANVPALTAGLTSASEPDRETGSAGTWR